MPGCSEPDMYGALLLFKNLIVVTTTFGLAHLEHLLNVLTDKGIAASHQALGKHARDEQG